MYGSGLDSDSLNPDKTWHIVNIHSNVAILGRVARRALDIKQAINDMEVDLASSSGVFGVMSHCEITEISAAPAGEELRQDLDQSNFAGHNVIL